MRCIVVVLAGLVATATARAEPLPDADPEATLRPDLVKMSARMFEPKGKSGALIETAREERAYDKAGRIERHAHKDAAGVVTVEYRFTWDAGGRLASRTYRDHTGRVERRDFTYKLDTAGRIVERDLRDPKAPAGELHRDVATWDADGSRTVVRSRHYATEGPYRDGVEVYDASGRLTRSCSEHGACSMYEYDARGAIDRIRIQPHDGDHYYRSYTHDYDKRGRVTREHVGGTDARYTWGASGDVVAKETRLAGAVESRTVYSYVRR